MSNLSKSALNSVSSYNSKYSKVNEWIKTNIKKEDLETQPTNNDKCNYVMSKLNEVPIDIIQPWKRPNLKSLYQLLYKLDYLNVHLKEDKGKRLEWIKTHRDEILNINSVDSKITNNKRIDYTHEKMNAELNTNYDKKQVRNFLTSQQLLCKHFTQRSFVRN